METNIDRQIIKTGGWSAGPGCHGGCGVKLVIKDGKLEKVEGDEDHPYFQGRTCTRVLALPQYIYHPDRLRYPVKRAGKRGEGKWQRISWDEAFDICEKKLSEIRDKYGAESTWSDPLEVIVTNNAPEKPATPEGPTSGSTKKTYTYSSSTTDSDGHKIYYYFDWGDGSNSGWIGPLDSGETASASHKWTSQGAFEVKVKARDEYNEESEWSDPLSISMPKEKSSIIIKIINRLNEIIQRIIHQLTII